MGRFQTAVSRLFSTNSNIISFAIHANTSFEKLSFIKQMIISSSLEHMSDCIFFFLVLLLLRGGLE